jgi:hypothetical protein
VPQTARSRRHGNATRKDPLWGCRRISRRRARETCLARIAHTWQTSSPVSRKLASAFSLERSCDRQPCHTTGGDPSPRRARFHIRRCQSAPAAAIRNKAAGTQLCVGPGSMVVTAAPKHTSAMSREKRRRDTPRILTARQLVRERFAQKAFIRARSAATSGMPRLRQRSRVPHLSQLRYLGPRPGCALLRGLRVRRKLLLVLAGCRRARQIVGTALVAVSRSASACRPGESP